MAASHHTTADTTASGLLGFVGTVTQEVKGIWYNSTIMQSRQCHPTLTQVP